MTRERIEDIREIVMPFVSRRLKEINYENLGESDAKEFERDFNEILNLAIKALEPVEPIGNSEELDCISRQEAIENVAQIAKAVAKSDKQKSLCGRIIYMLEHMREVEE